MHTTSILFLVRFNNSALTMAFYWSYTLLLKSPVLIRSWHDNRIPKTGGNENHLLCWTVST